MTPGSAEPDAPHLPDESEVDRLRRELHEARRRRDELQRRLDTILQSLYRSGVLILDTDGRYLFASLSQHERRRTPLSEDEFVGKTLEEVFEPRQAAWKRSLLEQVVGTGEPIEREYTTAGPDGTEFGIARLHPLRDAQGRVEAVVVHITDITDLKRAQHRAEHTRRRLDLALEAGNDGVWDYDVTTGEVHCSPRYYAILGYQPEQLANRFEVLTGLIHPDDREHVIETLRTRLRQADRLTEIEYRVRNRQGRYLWVQARAAVASRSPEGRPARVVGTITDITARKRTQQALKLEQEALVRSNIALREVAGQTRRKTREMARDVQRNVDQIIMPILDAMEGDASRRMRRYVGLLRRNVQELTSPFVGRLVRRFASLSPQEVRLCDMVRRGLSSKEIARVLDITPETVNRHRSRIRRKLDLTGSKQSLAKFLSENMHRPPESANEIDADDDAAT